MLASFPCVSEIGISDLSQSDLTFLLPLAGIQSLGFMCGDRNHLENLTELTHFHNLHTLSICNYRGDVHAVETLTSLKTLSLTSCNGTFEGLNIEHLPNLQSLKIMACFNFSHLRGMSAQHNLQHLEIELCGKLISLNWLQSATHLQHLVLKSLSQLKNLQGVEGLTSLQRIEVRNMNLCSGITQLMQLPHLVEAKIANCGALPPEHIKELEAHLQARRQSLQEETQSY